MKLGTRRTLRYNGLVRRCELRCVRYAGYFQWRDLDNGECFLTSLKPEYYHPPKPPKTFEQLSLCEQERIQRLAVANGLTVRAVMKVLG